MLKWMGKKKIFTIFDLVLSNKYLLVPDPPEILQVCSVLFCLGQEDLTMTSPLLELITGWEDSHRML